MKILTRRNLLAGGATAVGAALLGGRSARAAIGDPKNLLIVSAVGGWDTTYSIDPKPTNLPMIDAPDGTIEEVNGIALLTDPGRPNIRGFFEDFGDITAVVNGVSTSSISHTSGYRKIMTGTSDFASPDMAAITAFEHGADLAAPYLVLGTVSFSGPYGSAVTRTGTLNQISTLVDPAQGFPLATGEAANDRYVPGSIERNAIESHVRSRAEAFLERRGGLGRNAQRGRDYVDAIDRAALLKDVEEIQAVNFTQSLDAQVDMAVDALDSGMSQAVQIELAGFDTHTGNVGQGPVQEQLFAELRRLIGRLDGRGLLENTVVVVLSELGRTPLLNAEAGKDHWPVTSAMVIGTEVAGGQTIGATNDSFDGRNVDLDTGALGGDGVPLRHSNLAAGVLELVGVDPAMYLGTAAPLRALQA